MASHSETVIAGVLAQLAAIGGSNDDSFTPQVVERYDPHRTEVATVPSIALRWIDETSSDTGGEGLGFQFSLTLEVYVFLFLRAGSDKRGDEVLLDATHDVRRALYAIDWQTLRAILASVAVRPLSEDNDQEAYDGLLFTVSITYNVAPEDIGLSLS